jgi:hypothetical protein
VQGFRWAEAQTAGCAPAIRVSGRHTVVELASAATDHRSVLDRGAATWAVDAKRNRWAEPTAARPLSVPINNTNLHPPQCDSGCASILPARPTKRPVLAIIVVARWIPLSQRSQTRRSRRVDGRTIRIGIGWDGCGSPAKNEWFCCADSEVG